jgi:hypothetical protein
VGCCYWCHLLPLAYLAALFQLSGIYRPVSIYINTSAVSKDVFVASFCNTPYLTEENQSKQNEDNHLPSADSECIPPNESVRSMTMIMITMTTTMIMIIIITIIIIVVVVW